MWPLWMFLTLLLHTHIGLSRSPVLSKHSSSSCVIFLCRRLMCFRPQRDTILSTSFNFTIIFLHYPLPDVVKPHSLQSAFCFLPLIFLPFFLFPSCSYSPLCVMKKAVCGLFGDRLWACNSDWVDWSKNVNTGCWRRSWCRWSMRRNHRWAE